MTHRPLPRHRAAPHRSSLLDPHPPRRRSRPSPTPLPVLPALPVLSALLVLLALLVLGSAAAQGFDADRYLQQCLRFEAGGDLETAEHSCVNALQVDPERIDAGLALARIQVALGRHAEAETRLQRLRRRTDSAEPLLLLTDITLAGNRLAEAEALLDDARRRLERRSNRELAARHAFLAGRLAEARGRYPDALRHYRQAIESDSLQVGYRLADARLRLELGDAAGARSQLQSYQGLAGDTRDPEVKALLGRASWALGELDEAAALLNNALALRSSRQTEAQARDLQSLALVYYGGGDLQRGGVALREWTRRGNLMGVALSDNALWLLLALLLVAAHLVGESRIANATTLEVVERPQPWSVGQVYGALALALLVALAAALAYSLAVHGNLLAIATPLQGSDVRALLLATLSVGLALQAIRTVQRHGWDPVERLLGRGDGMLAGVGAGLLMLAAALAYLALRPDNAWLGPLYLGLARLTPLLVVALVLLPLSELFFRAFAFPALEQRYGASVAVVASGALSALVLATPVPLVFAAGLLLAELFRRRRSGLTPLVALLVFHLGLIVAVSFSPWAHALFV